MSDIRITLVSSVKRFVGKVIIGKIYPPPKQKCNDNVTSISTNAKYPHPWCKKGNIILCKHQTGDIKCTSNIKYSAYVFYSFLMTFAFLTRCILIHIVVLI